VVEPQDRQCAHPCLKTQPPTTSITSSPSTTVANKQLHWHAYATMATTARIFTCLSGLRSSSLLLRPALRNATLRHHSRQAADSANFTSVLDAPPTLIRAGQKRHGPGLLILSNIFSIPAPSHTNESSPQLPSPLRPSLLGPGKCSGCNGKPTC
jgi:hypothetical protein